MIHVRILVSVAGQRPIDVLCNTQEMGPFSVHPGDSIAVRGRYYYDDPRSDGIDWTHHNDPGASWPDEGGIQINDGRIIR
jgi:hypothetical protein